MATQDYISKEERAAIRAASESIASSYVMQRLEGHEGTITLTWSMLDNVHFVLRKAGDSGSGLWLSASSNTARGHNCVASDKHANRSMGCLTLSRFDATEFIDWIEEEITEAIIRYKIICRIKAQANGKLKDLISKSDRRRSGKANPMNFQPGRVILLTTVSAGPQLPPF